MHASSPSYMCVWLGLRKGSLGWACCWLLETPFFPRVVRGWMNLWYVVCMGASLIFLDFSSFWLLFYELCIPLSVLIDVPLKVCLDLGKMEGKKKMWKVTFFPLFDLREIQKKKIEKKIVRKTCGVMKKIFSF